MLIDKSKFVALVGAIATSTACFIVSDDDDKKSDDDGGDTTTATTSTTSSSATGSTTNASSGDTASSSASSGGGDCLADEGTPGACSGECEGFSTCDVLTSLTLGVAEDIVPCLDALDPATCSIFTDARATCLFDSLAKACDDPAASATCTEIATGCAYTDDATWQDTCMGRLNGLVPDGRTRVATCVKDGCEFGLTIDDCLNDLFFPPQ